MVGHRCVIEGKIGANTMIAIGASVLLDAIIGDLCLVAADAVVLENMNIPDRSFVAGVPATIKGKVTQNHIDLMDYFLSYYVGLVRQYKEQGIWRR
jgi:carbonic anhydrase/acetyltransferase-like protein (isoleucine patch superfamily)